MPKTVAPVVIPGSMRGHAQPVLYVDELTLRPWTVGDVPALVAAYADPSIQRWHARWMTLTEANEWVSRVNENWRSETAANWAVTERDELVGRMSLRTVDLEDGLAGIGYWVVPAARGRGIAPRALVAVSDWAIDELGLHRLELEHSTRNQASCRVADKAGYSLESTKRSQALHEDGWHDMHLHVRLDRRWCR
ncbi:MAG TPA: GNAT family N-acetyltransferase [Propionibacteriaceae bacterium]|nr:GNAT family N-acetyltransferase [Propionibacteriaceae bacterium]